MCIGNKLFILLVFSFFYSAASFSADSFTLGGGGALVSYPASTVGPHGNCYNSLDVAVDGEGNVYGCKDGRWFKPSGSAEMCGFYSFEPPIGRQAPSRKTYSNEVNCVVDNISYNPMYSCPDGYDMREAGVAGGKYDERTESWYCHKK